MKSIRWLIYLIVTFHLLAFLLTRTSVHSQSTFSLFLPLISRQPPPAWLGPPGGNAVYLVIDPSDPQTMYLGAWYAGVFRSLDGGASWSPARAGLGGVQISALAIDPQDSSTLYAAVYYDGLYKSTNHGATWTRYSQGLKYPNTVIYDIEIDPSNPQRLYLATRASNGVFGPPWRGVVYRSLDGGLNWVPVLENIGGAGQQDWAYSLAILPASPNLILAASHEHGPYRSQDGGQSWTPVHKGIDDLSARAILFNPQVGLPGTAYVGTWHYGGVYKTTDGGNYWTQKGATSYKILKMAIDHNQPNYIYGAVPDDGVLKSADSGKTWQITGLAEAYVQMVTIHPTQGASLYASTANSGIQFSPDHGQHWSPANHGFITAYVTSTLVRSGHSNELLISTLGYGVLRSTDGGVTWSDFNAGMGDPNVHQILFDPNNPNVLFALTGSKGLFRLDLAGKGTWIGLAAGGSTEQTQPLPSPSNRPVHPPWATPTWNDPLDAGTFYPPETLPQQPSAASLLTMTFAPSNPQIAYLGVYNGGVRKSVDGGYHWTSTNLGGASVWSLAVDPVDPNTVYAASDTPGAINKTVDGGVTWTSITLPGVTFFNLAYPPHDHTWLYAGTNQGLYTLSSSNDWSLVGLAGQAVISFGFAPDTGWLYAGTTNGVFYANKEDAWLPGSPRLLNFAVSAITFDPGNPQVIYFSTDSAGILRFHR